MVDHLELYKLSWLQNNNDIRANRGCLIQFSIGWQYREILSIVILMDTGQLLTGRPWLYNQKVIYDGFMNTYSFTRDRVKIKVLLYKWRVHRNHRVGSRGHFSTSLNFFNNLNPSLPTNDLKAKPHVKVLLKLYMTLILATHLTWLGLDSYPDKSLFL